MSSSPKWGRRAMDESSESCSQVWSTEDDFIGFGLEMVRPHDGKAKIEDETEKMMMGRIIDACGGADHGKVPLAKLMSLLENNTCMNSSEVQVTLHRLYLAFRTESEKNGIKDEEILVDVFNSDIIKDLINHYRENLEINLWDPPKLLDSLDSSKSLVIVNSTTDKSNFTGDGSDSSSLGILSSLEMSLFSQQSIEAVGGDVSFKDVTEVQGEVDQLKFLNRKLAEEKVELMKQMCTTEDDNKLLVNDNERLLKQVQSLQILLDKAKELDEENANIKVALVTADEKNRELLSKILQDEANQAAYEDQITNFKSELDTLQSDLESATKNKKMLQNHLHEHKQLVRELGEKKFHYEGLYKEYADKYSEAEKVISELTAAVESLTKEKNTLEINLYRAQEEIAGLKELLEAYQKGSLEDSKEDDGPESDEGVFDDTHCTTPPPAPPSGLNISLDQAGHKTPFRSQPVLTSTPVHCNFFIDNLSICAEMKDVVISSESLPVPFCGRAKAAKNKETFPMERLQGFNQRAHRKNFRNACNRITAFLQGSISDYEDSDTESNTVEMESKVKKQENKIQDLELELSKKKEEHLNMMDKVKELQSLLSSVQLALTEESEKIKDLNAEAIKMLEAQAEALTIAGQIKAGSSAVLDTQLATLGTDEPITHELSEALPEEIVRDQINLELQTLRAQIARSQAILAYWQTKGQKLSLGTSTSTTSSGKKRLYRQRYSEEGPHPDDHPYSSLYVSDRFPSKHPVESEACLAYSTVIVSNRSSPSHRVRHIARSCPAIPSHEIVATRGTQTEAEDLKVSDVPQVSSGSGLCQTNNTLTVPADTYVTVQSVEETGMISEVETPASPEVRNRSYSFVTAIKQGNPNLVDASEMVPNEGVKSPETCGKEAVPPNPPSYQVAVQHHYSQEGHSQTSVRHDTQTSYKSQSTDSAQEACYKEANERTEPRIIVQDVEDQSYFNRTSSKKRKSLSEVTRSGAIDLDHGDDFVEEDYSSSREKWKKRESRNKGLMPDLMESSETESAKGSASGSMESETGEMVVVPPPAGSDPAFPSFPDSFLTKLNLHKDTTAGSEQLTDQEIESKFTTLSLGFKTDKLTLSKRLELQQRQRDIAEKNIESELKAVRELVTTLNQLCSDPQMRDVIMKIQNHIDVIQQSTGRVSSRAEVFGAVQQEERMCRAFEVMVTHVENLKRVYEKEHRELEETKRLLTENHLLHPESSTISEGLSEDGRSKSLRTFISASKALGGCPVLYTYQPAKNGNRRRASVAVLHHPSSFEELKNSSVQHDARSRLFSAVTAVNFSSTTRLTSQSSCTNLLSSHRSAARRCSLPVGPIVGFVRPTASPACGEECYQKEDSASNNGNSEDNDESAKGDASKKTECEGSIIAEAIAEGCIDEIKDIADKSNSALGESSDSSKEDIESSPVVPSSDNIEAAANVTEWEKFVSTTGRWSERFRVWIESGRKLVNRTFPLPLDNLTTVRYAFSVFLVLAAMFSLLVAILPSPVTACTRTIYYTSLQEFIEKRLSPILNYKKPALY